MGSTNHTQMSYIEKETREGEKLGGKHCREGVWEESQWGNWVKITQTQCVHAWNSQRIDEKYIKTPCMHSSLFWGLSFVQGWA